MPPENEEDAPPSDEEWRRRRNAALRVYKKIGPVWDELSPGARDDVAAFARALLEGGARNRESYRALQGRRLLAQMRAGSIQLARLDDREFETLVELMRKALPPGAL